MPTRRLGDAPKYVSPYSCKHPEHDPPDHRDLAAGFYEHTCPACGHLVQFVVNGVPMVATPDVYTVKRREDHWTESAPSGDIVC